MRKTTVALKRASLAESGEETPPSGKAHQGLGEIFADDKLESYPVSM